MEWVVKLTKHYGQYRITLPRELVEKEGFENVKYVRLAKGIKGGILIEEYHGKSKEKRGIPEDRP